MRRKPRQPKSTLSPLIKAITHETYRQKFSDLRLVAQQHCIASDDMELISGKAGFLLFVTLRALAIDELEIEDQEVIEALALMGDALGDANEKGSITAAQRTALIDGMDYLDALIQALSKNAVAIGWYQVDQAALKGHIGTADLETLLSKLKGKEDEA